MSASERLDEHANSTGWRKHVQLVYERRHPMHKHSIVLGLALVLIASLSVQAQVPTVAVYFDAGLQNQTTVCGSGIDTWYVVAENFPDPVEAMEYQITYPSAVLFIQDNAVAGGLLLGTSPNGIAITWPTPQAFSSKGLVQTVSVLWNCNDCSTTDIPVVVLPAPCSGLVRGIGSDLSVMLADGLTSLICPTVPVEQSTWGRIKALYDG